MLKIIHEIPFEADSWPGFWVWTDVENSGSLEVAQFAIRFNVCRDTTLKLHLSADNQYKLYLDGRFVGTGPQKGDVYHWYFDTYHFSGLDFGEHVISAVVCCNKYMAPTSQISVRPAFLAVAEDEYGVVFNDPQNWKGRKFSGYKPLMVPEEAMHAGSGFDIGGLTADDIAPSSELLEKAFFAVEPLPLGSPRDGRSTFDSYWGWRLTPRTIPALECEYHSLGKIVRSELIERNDFITDFFSSALCNTVSFPIKIPSHTKCRFLIDRGALVKGVPVLVVSGGKGGHIALTYQEGLQQCAGDISTKGHRDHSAGCVAVGVADLFRPDGRENVVFEPLVYRCWRYISCEVVTGDDSVELHSMMYRSTGYPYEFKAEIEADPWIERLVAPGLKTLRMCADDTYLDCPYYERLQYIGDTRIQALLSYVLAGDDRLARQAIGAFDQSRLPDGMIQSRYPSRCRQIIPTFSLLYISVLHDFMMWRGDIPFLSKYLPGVKIMLDFFEQHEGENGFLANVPGWCFVDWSSDRFWVDGMPPVDRKEVNYLLNFQYLYALGHACALFQACGKTLCAKEFACRAQTLRENLKKFSFDSSRTLFADDSGFNRFSQHASIMAILTNTHVGLIEGSDLIESLLRDEHIAAVSCYFSFYLFEAMFMTGRADLIWPELSHWHEMLDCGLTTFSEHFGQTRSDCHGWSVHPLYHFFASILGIRPAEVGFGRAIVQPKLGALNRVRGKFVHPHGMIEVDLRQSNGEVSGVVRFPDGVEWTQGSNDQLFDVKHAEHDFALSVLADKNDEI